MFYNGIIGTRLIFQIGFPDESYSNVREQGEVSNPTSNNLKREKQMKNNRFETITDILVVLAIFVSAAYILSQYKGL